MVWVCTTIYSTGLVISVAIFKENNSCCCSFLRDKLSDVTLGVNDILNFT